MKIDLYSLEDETSIPKLVGPLFCKSTVLNYQSLQVMLEDVGVVDSQFDFWEPDSKCKVRSKL